MKHAGPIAVTLLTATLAACGGGGDTPPQDATGRLNLALTDAPVDGASAAIIVFTGLELQPANGQRVVFDFDSERHIDLLAFQNGATVDLLRDAQVPAGDYRWMRLKVLAERNLQDGSRIEFADTSGNTFPLYVPSGAESGLKLNRPFRVAAGGVTRLVADFDLRKSVIAPAGQEPNYVLKPVLRLMDELETGTLAGTVDLRALANRLLETSTEPRPVSECSAGVYLFEQDAEGAPTDPDDMDGDPADGRDPVVYFPLEWDGVNDTAPFEVALLATGRYTVAATCQYNVDAAPDVSDYDPRATPGGALFGTMRWSVVGDVVISAGDTVEVVLPASRSSVPGPP
jgi:hypothetical protein